MNLFLTYEKFKRIFFSQGDLFALARIDLLVDGRMTAPIPSYALENDYNGIILQNGLEHEVVDGIQLTKTHFVNSVLYWGEKKEAYVFSDKVKSHLLDIEPCTYIAVSDFYKIPKNGFYCEVAFDNYYGFLVSWDYYINSDGNQVDFLNISLFAECNDGLVVSLELPKRYEVYDFSKHQQQENSDVLMKVVGLMMYILHQREDAIETMINGHRYMQLGQKLASNIKKKEEESKGRKGHWRRGHFHLYWFVIKGVRTAVNKWIEPTWVSASKPKQKPINEREWKNSESK